MAAEPADSASKEAFQFWGYLFKQDNCGVDLLDRLLAGIANYITSHYEPSECPDITPSQLATFYRAVGGDYDVLFVETPPGSLAFIYKSIGCLHSLQPAPNGDTFASPCIPALKKKGFIKWQTIQLLLGPEEHVPFLQNAVRDFDIIDPATGNLFPKILPKESFPDKPDAAMVQWYEGVSERLGQEARAEEQRNASTRAHVEVDEPRTSSETSGDSSVDDHNEVDERNGAAEYFRNPMYRNREGRPAIVRRFSKNPSRSPLQFVENRGRVVANSVRHFWNPWSRRRSFPDRCADEDGEFEDNPTPTDPQSRYVHKRPHPRREDSLSSTDSISDVPRYHPSPVLRHRRSHEPPSSPREYFPPYYEERRYSQDNRNSEPPAYGPTKSPLFATHVAQMQANNRYDRPDRRSAMPPRSTLYPRQNVRYAVKQTSPRDSEPPVTREPYEYTNRSSRQRSREHDRDWDRDRDRDRERDRDRDRQRVHRYVAPVDGGVGGRRYPVDAPWR